jgi:4-hydroxy-tetrahydrodipicolinate reductase
VVVGTSGLSAADYADAVGNFALTVVLMQKFAEIAAKWIPHGGWLRCLTD